MAHSNKVVLNQAVSGALRHLSAERRPRDLIRRMECIGANIQMAMAKNKGVNSRSPSASKPESCISAWPVDRACLPGWPCADVPRPTLPPTHRHRSASLCRPGPLLRGQTLPPWAYLPQQKMPDMASSCCCRLFNIQKPARMQTVLC
jgi:hypothetical protein